MKTIIIVIALALAIAFLMKGKLNNKFIAVAFFIVGMLCFEASSFWWRLGFIILVLCSCDTGEIQRTPASYMAIALTFVAMCLVRLVATDLFGWYPEWIFNILALGGALIYVFNVNED